MTRTIDKYSIITDVLRPFSIDGYIAIGDKQCQRVTDMLHKRNSSIRDIGYGNSAAKTIWLDYSSKQGEHATLLFAISEQSVNRDNRDIVSLLSHEAYHAVSFLRQFIGETDDEEFSAYFAGHLTKALWDTVTDHKAEQRRLNKIARDKKKADKAKKEGK